VADVAEVFLDGLNQPFGMALLGEIFYVGNTDGVVAFPWTAGTRRVTGPGRKQVEFKPGGHWTRSLLPNMDSSKSHYGQKTTTNSPAPWSC
jgi:glucose/arabinose dehydrogenase